MQNLPSTPLPELFKSMQYPQNYIGGTASGWELIDKMRGVILSKGKLEHKSGVTHLVCGIWAQAERLIDIQEVVNKTELLGGCPTPTLAHSPCFQGPLCSTESTHHALDQAARKQEPAASLVLMAAQSEVLTEANKRINVGSNFLTCVIQ